ncbi:DUF1289 domain-containing protein [Uliginosibacterium sp. TH139]|uniref:DUF1289 domain-containing protein n=1 Tax=unclassified Uliginosibacterium TaxID=2621521 RepID=UPI000C7C496C|nr:DUF1289 domain-containing protein [Uliginosibacterium sp. TH139]MDO6385928.1 DUF1289 domain-containing protein [Uliginosibacterium sp. 31-12]PLK49938.1 DUF1289 domain-containing protein [Uliginosibacterium sp. TH139]
MAVPSPCIDVCVFDGKTGFCTSCLRTREEARSWKKMSDTRRHQILHDRRRREQKLERKRAESD